MDALTSVKNIPDSWALVLLAIGGAVFAWEKGWIKIPKLRKSAADQEQPHTDQEVFEAVLLLKQTCEETKCKDYRDAVNAVAEHFMHRNDGPDEAIN